MKCTSVQDVLELYVLGDLADDQLDQVRGHLVDCADCRAIEQEYRLIVRRIRNQTQPEAVKLEFVRSLQETAAREIAKLSRRNRLLRFAVRACSVAAGLLFLVLLWQSWSYFGRQGQDYQDDFGLSEQVGVELSSGNPPRFLQAMLGGQVRSVPTSPADGVVIRGDKMYMLLDGPKHASPAAINIRTGEIQWQAEIESCGHLAADGRRVFCLRPIEPGKIDLVALDSSSGKVLWCYRHKGPRQFAGPVRPTEVDDDRVCWSGNKTVSMIDAHTGEPIWIRSFDDNGLLCRAIFAEGRIFVAGVRSIYCLDAGNGREIWSKRFSGELSRWIRPLLTICQGRLYVAHGLLNGQSQLVCLNMENFRVLWSRVSQRITHLNGRGGRLYLRNESVETLDGLTGEMIWSFRANGCGPVTHLGSQLCFVDTTGAGSLIGVDERTGVKLWELDGLRSCDGLFRVGRTGYLKTRDGTVQTLAFSR
ncbi:MAG: PQQ-binding-like beta-propeller repeat protein [Sedimentisphaerales bacterium]|nr:PQQ-binding-like beta-propeller repeat protein [Sedimentisphaerales bacterium]